MGWDIHEGLSTVHVMLFASACVLWFRIGDKNISEKRRKLLGLGLAIIFLIWVAMSFIKY